MAAPPESSEAPRKLPVIATARETYAVILRNPGAFLAAAMLPFAIYLANGYFYGFYYSAAVSVFDISEGPSQIDLLGAELFLDVANWFVVLLAITLLGLAWHSFVIVGKRLPRWRIPRISRRRWWRYFLWLAVLIALTSTLLGKAKVFAFHEVREIFGTAEGIANTLEIQAGIFTNVAIDLIVASFWIRLALVLPMAAVSSRPYGLRQSWRDTRSQGVRFLLIIGLVYLPYAGVIELLNWAQVYAFYAEQYGLGESWIANALENSSVAMAAHYVISAFRSTLFMGIVISLLSVVFLKLKGRDLALAELAEDQERKLRTPFRERARAAIRRAKYWRQPD